MTKRLYTGAEANRMAALWRAGVAIADIARTVGRTPGSASEFMKRNRDRFPSRPTGRPVTIDKGTALRMRSSGATIHQIAEHFDVSNEGVRKALKVAA